MTEKSELDFLHQQLFKYAKDIARLYEELKTGYSKDEIEDRIKKPEAFAEIITNSKEMLSIFIYIESIAHHTPFCLFTDIYYYSHVKIDSRCSKQVTTALNLANLKS